MLGALDLETLSRSTSGLSILFADVPQAAGNTEAFIGTALQLSRSDPVGSSRLDIAMTRLLVKALNGDATAQLVVMHVRRRYRCDAEPLLSLALRWTKTDPTHTRCCSSRKSLPPVGSSTVVTRDHALSRSKTEIFAGTRP